MHSSVTIIIFTLYMLYHSIIYSKRCNYSIDDGLAQNVEARRFFGKNVELTTNQ